MKPRFGTQTVGGIVLVCTIVFWWSPCIAQDDAAGLQASRLPPVRAGSSDGEHGDDRSMSLDSWTAMGPNGITANDVAVYPQNTNIIYAGGLSGLYKSTNGGTSWQLTNAVTQNNRVICVSVHPSNPDLVFAWTQPNFGSFLASLMRSSNGGATWSEVLKRQWTIPPAVFFDTLHAKLFAGSDSMFTSTNSGITWTSGQPLGVYSLAASYLNPNLLYANASTAIYKTTDGGTTWNPLAASRPSKVGASRTLRLSPTNDSTLFAGNTSLIDTIGGVYRSTDGGLTWQVHVSGMGMSKSVYALAPDPSTPGVIYAGGLATGVYRSSNSGDTWTIISDSIQEHYVYSLTVAPGGRLYCGTGGGIFWTSNQGSSWQSISGDLRSVDVFNVVINPSDPATMYAGSLGGVYRTSNGGTSWQKMNKGLVDNDMFSLVLDPSNPSVLYAGSYGGLIYKTTNSGNSWSALSSGLPAFARMTISTLRLSPKHPSHVWTSQSFTNYQSTDGGTTWAPFVANGHALSDVAYDAAHPDTLYAIAADTLLRSTNDGSLWTTQRTGVRLINLTVDPGKPGTLFADSSGTARSTDAGVTWVRVDTITSRSLYVNPGNSKFVYAATFGAGIRRSTDGGTSWSSYNNSLPNLATFTICSTPSLPHRLFCTTYGSGIYSTDELATFVRGGPSLVSRFSLSQNFPNPFNPSTTISFDIPARSFVSLNVIDVTGREVATIVSEELPAGRYSRTWNAAGCASGVYFCRLRAGSFFETKKLLLLK